MEEKKERAFKKSVEKLIAVAKTLDTPLKRVIQEQLYQIKELLT